MVGATLKEQQRHVPTLPVPLAPTPAPDQAPREASPSISHFPAPKADSFPPEGHFYLFPGKGDQQLQKCPQQLQLLSQACLGMEMCSWHKKSRPEPAFGYQPWVWFEILPEEKVHPLVLPQTLEKSPATKSNPCLPSSSSAHLSGEAQAAAPWHLSKPHWPPIHRSQCQNL